MAAADAEDRRAVRARAALSRSHSSWSRSGDRLVEVAPRGCRASP